MKKSLIVLAVAGIFAAPVAMAEEVVIYGAVDMAFGSWDNGATSTNQVSSQSSKLGFKGAEDLGGGTSAIWQIEQQVDPDGAGPGVGTGLFATRNSFAGLKSESMGTLLMGRYDTPYKIATRRLDLFGDQAPDNRSLMGGGAANNASGLHDKRLTDVVNYTSPSMNGFTVGVAYGAAAETATLSTNTKGSIWSMAGMYDSGPMFLSLSYQQLKYGSAGTGTAAVPTGYAVNDSDSAWKLGGSYKIDALQLNLVYEKTTSSIAGTGDRFGRQDWYLGGKYSFGSDAIKLAYTSAGKVGTAGTNANYNTSAAKQISIGYDHSMSKTTTLYAQYSRIANDTNAAYKFTNASTGGAIAVAAGNDPSVWAVGMKHSF